MDLKPVRLKASFGDGRMLLNRCYLSMLIISFAWKESSLKNVFVWFAGTSF